MTELQEFTWASTESEAIELQRNGWRPSKRGHEMHHAEFGMLLVRDVLERKEAQAQ